MALDLLEATNGSGAIRIGFTGYSGLGANWGYANVPPFRGQTANEQSGDIWIRDAYRATEFAIGSSDWYALLHEIGHALGLKHPFEEPKLPTEFESVRYSIMSYTQIGSYIVAVGNNATGWSASYIPVYPTTPMVLDIAAVQNRYGVETGIIRDDVYRPVQGSADLSTIFDAGGIDLLDLSAFTRRSVVDLAPGSYSSLGAWSTAEQIAHWKGAAPANLYPSIDGWFSGVNSFQWTDNLGIAFDTFIENAVGGVGPDELRGNGLANELQGRDGDDALFGRDGDDLLMGGGGADVLFGEAGADTFRYLALSDSTAAGSDGLFGFETGVDRVDLTALSTGEVSLIRSGGATFLFARSATGAFQLASLQDLNVSDLVGVNHGVFVIGSATGDTVRGGAFADVIQTGDGADTIFGGGGADLMFGGAGADVFSYASRGDSTLALADTVFDFASGVDRIDLRGVRTGAADRFGVVNSGPNSFLFVDLGGDGVNDMLIQLQNVALQTADVLWG